MKKTSIIQRMWAKVLAFILFIIFLGAIALGGLSASAMLSLGVYYQDVETVKDVQIYRGRSPGWRETLYTYDDIGEIGLRDLCDRYLMCYVKIENITKDKIIVEFGDENLNYRTESESFNCDVYSDNGGIDYTQGDVIKVTRHYDFSPERLKTNTTLYLMDKAIDLAYALKYWIYPIIVASFVLCVLTFVFLMCSSGRKVGNDGVSCGWGTKVPFDILLVATFGAVALIMSYLSNVWTWRYYGELERFAIIILGLLTSVVISLGFCMSFALRIKLGGWWKNTIVYYIFKLLARLWCKARMVFKAICKLFFKIPLIWKSTAIILGITIMEFLLLMINIYEADNLMIIWIVEKVLLIPAALYVAFSMKSLKSGARQIAEGKSGAAVDTKYLILDFKEHGEDLNRIRDGINVAVEQKMKSERMKTELITNVSHDIKTPLTSIINYSDLIAGEPTDNEKIKEYSSVLLRQSERLKRLIDDLVEASKASTGNLEIISSPFELGVLFTQTAGEYEEKFLEKNLTLVTDQPDTPVFIMADGRRMWRIFDNLMNNICKYAQGGTRVYLTLETQDNTAIISFKNISREALNMPADELMERFARGDASRNTEGNGLGLSIANSLAQLQNGSLQLTVDGDLFKVVLKFPVINE